MESKTEIGQIISDVKLVCDSFPSDFMNVATATTAASTATTATATATALKLDSPFAAAGSNIESKLSGSKSKIFDGSKDFKCANF